MDQMSFKSTFKKSPLLLNEAFWLVNNCHMIYVAIKMYHTYEHTFAISFTQAIPTKCSSNS